MLKKSDEEWKKYGVKVIKNNQTVVVFAKYFNVI